MYREDYRRAGFRFIPEGRSEVAGYQIALGCGALVAASLLPYALGNTGVVYAIGVTALGIWFLKVCLRAALSLSGKTARRAFLASILYLPLLLTLLVVDRAVL